MHASVRRYTASPSDAPAILERINGSDIGALIKGIPGCLAYYVIDAGDGVLATVSVFEDQAGVDASTETAAAWVRDNIAGDFTIGAPEITSGEVIIRA